MVVKEESSNELEKARPVQGHFTAEACLVVFYVFEPQKSRALLMTPGDGVPNDASPSQILLQM